MKLIVDNNYKGCVGCDALIFEDEIFNHQSSDLPYLNDLQIQLINLFSAEINGKGTAIFTKAINSKKDTKEIIEYVEKITNKKITKVEQKGQFLF